LSAPTVPDLERHGSPGAGRAVLLLPGYADGPEVFRDQLALLDADDSWYVAIARPVRTGPHGPLWYWADDRGPDPEQLAEAVASVDAALDLVATEAGVPRDHLVLAGHSQGGALCLATALDPGTRAVPRGVGVLGGYLPDRPDGLLALERLDGVPLLVAHSPDDATIDYLRGRSAAKALGRAGADVRFVEVGGEHRLGPDLAAPLGAWLADLAGC
jgi:phospholipase/carboxylesterase